MPTRVGISNASNTVNDRLSSFIALLVVLSGAGTMLSTPLSSNVIALVLVIPEVLFQRRDEFTYRYSCVTPVALEHWISVSDCVSSECRRGSRDRTG